MTTITTTTDSNIIETTFKTKEGYNECDHCQSVLSPAAYFVKLLEIIEKYICADSLDNLEIEQGTINKLLGVKEGGKSSFDSACKITSSTEEVFIRKVKGTISEQEAKNIYQKAKALTLKQLKTRRPDLFNKIKLDCDNTNKEKLYLEIVNQIMEENLKKGSNEDILQKLATAKYPFNLPANFPLISICAYLREHNISLAEVYKALISNVDTALEHLDLSPEGYQMIIYNDMKEDYLKEAYGTQSLDQLKKVEKFIAQTDIDDKLKLLLDSYNKIKKLADSTKLSIDSTNQTIINLDNQALGFLHRFIRLANKLNWSFEELGDVLVAVGKDEINKDFVKQIARIKNLQDRFKQPVTRIAELYAEADILSKKLKNLSEFKSLLNSNYGKLQELAKDENSYSALQDILNVSSNELTSLIEYNNNILSQTGKLLLFRVYKQVSLARLIGISIAELTQFLSLLDINELSSDGIERVVELNDWLKKHSITIQQLNDFINPYELYKKQASEIGQGEEKEILYNKISKYVQIQRDILDAAYEFTKKYGQSLTEKLLHNIAIFTTLKLSAEDISNIIKYENTYGIQAKWSLSQIKTLVNYKTLKDTFSSDSVIQYTDWLNGKDYNENKVVDKIAQLTGWNKDTLEDIKKIEGLKSCFTKEKPIDSLLKIKSFMDLVTKSGINSRVLLSLKDLYNLAVGNKWKKYTDAARNLELSAGREAKAEKYLAGRKRDILASYMIYKLKLRNMRDLYSHLLIDVEMSDCSVISPLKAALNSVQLYIHRSIMKLEQGVKVKPGLNEEKWKWLSSYREWEASNKIKLYPENYLNPTLRRIATPGYKTLQNTLMQGNITDETVSDAYVKYFEDFEQAASLKIVDSCFEKVEDKISGGEKNTLYIIGCTLAKPYNYYYRTAIFDERNQQILYWTAWEKIEALIPIETVTPIYAFNRLFIFWVQQIEKGKEGKEGKRIDATINYIFQKPSGSWSAQQELASNVKVDPKEMNKLYWKKVAAFYLTEEGGKEKRIVAAIGEMEPDTSSSASPSSLFTLDEDLVTNENKSGFFLDASYNTKLNDETSNLSCDIDKKGEDKLTLNFTKNVFKSNVTNKEDNAEFLSGKPPVELLGEFKVSLTQQVINKPGWFIVEGNLKRENIRESFLLLPKNYDLASISSQSTYKIDSNCFKFKYYSEIPITELDGIEFTFTRLNITGNIRKLRQKAYVGGPKRILTLESQTCDPNEQLKFERFEPKDRVIDPPSDCFDFSGAYGIYLWEIFFHVPELVALHLRQEQDFATARKWYQYILNPTNDKNQTWQFLPFTERDKQSIINDSKNTQTIQELEIDPFDPYVIAKQRTTAFEKYIIKSYIDNLIDWGDMLFAKKSWEALNQATMLYVRAWDLLGHKPIKKEKSTIEAKTFEELKSNQKSSNLCKLEAELPSTNTQLVKIQSTNEIYDVAKYGCYFCKPENEEFIGLWDKVEDRLYKIRHCLDITGKRLELPLFQVSIDPKQLIQTIGSGPHVPVSSVQLPHYRFSYMIAYARSIVETVIQFGSELLSVLEKRDAEALAILYSKQEGIMANLMTTIKEKAIEALKEEAKALSASLNSAKDRKSHYVKLIEQGYSALEISSMALSVSATAAFIGAGVARGVASGLHFIPTIFGLSNGGFQPGSSSDSAARGLELLASVTKNISQDLSTSASYERRAQDWDLQEIMAAHDIEQISYQMEANKVNQANAIQDLKAHKESIKQIKEKEAFFKSKFTNQELYNWMKGQIAIIYFQAYKIALEITKQAEKTYQYELNNNNSFINNSSWDSLKEGLLAGSILKLALEQMAKDYHDKSTRSFEINRIISLGQIDPIALHELKTKGSCKFALTERLFDLDFPGHYCRKIKNIKITIPAVVGPYENIHASLQQTSNRVVIQPNINAIKYLLGENSDQPDDKILRVDWKKNQSVAISKGDQDSGLFELNFNDERYLPFEGTGVVSNWELSLPKATNRFDTSNISDIVIHIDYTALDGGEVLKGEITKLSKLKYYHGMLVINLSAAYPDIWKKFKQTGVKPYKLTFKTSTEIFPTYVKNPELEDSIYIVPKTSDGNQINVKMDDCKWNNTTYKISIPSKKIAIGSDWNLIISDVDSSQIEEVTIIIPYKAKINWQAS